MSFRHRPEFSVHLFPQLQCEDEIYRASFTCTCPMGTAMSFKVTLVDPTGQGNQGRLEDRSKLANAPSSIWETTGRAVHPADRHCIHTGDAPPVREPCATSPCHEQLSGEETRQRCTASWYDQGTIPSCPGSETLGPTGIVSVVYQPRPG